MVIMNLKTIIIIYSFITTKILYPLSHLFLQMNQKKPSVGYVRFKLPFYIRQKKKKRKEKERERERETFITTNCGKFLMKWEYQTTLLVY